MFGALIIVFREIIEAGLVVGIVLAATRGVPRRDLWVGYGILIMDAQRLSFRDRCRRNDERHVEILEYIAEHDTNTGFRLTAIRDLFDRGHGRPNQPLEGSGPGGSIPFQVVLPVAIHRLSYLLLACFRNGDWNGDAVDDKIDSSVISIAYRLSMAEGATWSTANSKNPAFFTVNARQFWLRRTLLKFEERAAEFPPNLGKPRRA